MDEPDRSSGLVHDDQDWLFATSPSPRAPWPRGPRRGWSLARGLPPGPPRDRRSAYRSGGACRRSPSVTTPTSRPASIRDGGHAFALARHLDDDVPERGTFRHDRQGVSREHEIRHPEQGAPAERAARVQRRVVFRTKPAELEEHHGQRVADRRARRSCSTWASGSSGTPLPARRRRARPRTGGPSDRGGIAGQEQDGHSQSLERWKDRQRLVRLPGVRQRQHDVAPRHHPEIAVDSFGRMEEVSRSAGRRERRGDLASDQSRLAHAGDDHAPGAAAQELDRALEALVELGNEARGSPRPR